MSGSFNQQNYSFNDGNAQSQYSSQQYSWSSSQQNTNAQTPAQSQYLPQPQIQQGPAPPMLPALDIGQFNQQHMSLHHASMQSALQTQQNMMNMMNTGMNRLPQQPSLLQSLPQQVHAQPQIEHAASPLSLMPAPETHSSLVSPDSQLSRRNDVFNDVMGEFNRGSAKIDARMQRFEESQAQDRRELAGARSREQQLQQQLLEAEQRHSRAVADMAQSQALAAQSTGPAFDISALQRIIAEVQTDRISRNDIKELVEDAVSKQLSGVARTSDIASAASRMEKGLNNVPTGASATEIQLAVQQELEKAVQKVARHMPTQQRSLEGPSQPVPVPWQQQPQRFETQLSVEELSDDELPVYKGASSAVKKSKTLPAPQVEQQNCALTPAALATVPGSGGSRSQHSKSRLSISPSDSNALARVSRPESQSASSSNMSVISARVPSVVQQTGSGLTESALSRLQFDAGAQPSSSKSRSSTHPASIAPSAHNALARVKDQDRGHSRTSKMSTVSVQPSASNAIARAVTSEVQPQRSSAEAMAIQQNRSGRPGEYAGHQAYAELPDEFPDNASQVSNWQRKRESKSTMSDKSTVSSIRPKNDRRIDIGQSPLRQVEATPEEAGSGMALVKQSRDMSKKSGR